MVLSPFCFCILSLLCGDIERSLTRLCLLTPHLYLEWPEAGSGALQEEVQQVGAAGWNVEVFPSVFAHAIWILVVFWSDLVAQLTGSWMTIG